MKIHTTAIIHKTATIDTGVEIGPYTVIGADVAIGKDCVIGSHCLIEGPTTVGDNNVISSHVSMGTVPQANAFDRAKHRTKLIIGNNNIFREFVSINRGTIVDTAQTIIGDNNFVMSYCQISHDCIIGNATTIVTGCKLAGHVQIGDYTTLGGSTYIHQYVRIGNYVMSAGNTAVKQNIPAYLICDGNPSVPYGVNIVGMRRNNFSPKQIRLVRNAYKQVYRKPIKLQQAVHEISSWGEIDLLGIFLSDINNSQPRGLARPKQKLL